MQCPFHGWVTGLGEMVHEMDAQQGLHLKRLLAPVPTFGCAGLCQRDRFSPRHHQFHDIKKYSLAWCCSDPGSFASCAHYPSVCQTQGRSAGIRAAGPQEAFSLVRLSQAIMYWVRSWSAIHLGALPRPVHVSPVAGLRYLGATVVPLVPLGPERLPAPPNTSSAVSPNWLTKSRAF